jgi:hypothetical protein
LAQRESARLGRSVFYIEQLIGELSEAGIDARLGETTLRGCVREILGAGEGLEIPKN